MGDTKIVSDFLPSPEELVLKDETVKVTKALIKFSVDFFKKEAKKYNTQYQKMIRRLLGPVYTARAMGSLLDLIHKKVYTKGQSVLFWHTGGTLELFAWADRF